MTPQYQFNLGQTDPLLSIAQNNPEGYISVIEQELQKLNNVKQQLIQAKQPTQQNINNAINIWDSINNKIIESAITFYFKDEDSGSTKTWNYFKTAN